MELERPFGDDPCASPAPGAKRYLVFHYHLFKNAGTSVDEMLRRNFPGRVLQQEFQAPPPARAEAVTEFVRSNPGAYAISSHTALLPVPRVEGVRIFPIIFLRHPIDRLRSAYAYERTQIADTMGARLAKEHDFAGYLRELLKLPDNRHVRNFQTYRVSRNKPGRKNRELQRAMRALGDLPFVGLVEKFAESLQLLELRLRPLFPCFRAEIAHVNITSPQSTLTERLESVRAMLGEALYEEVCAANLHDQALHDAVNLQLGPAVMELRSPLIERTEGARQGVTR